MDDTKQDQGDEKSEPQKPIADQVTDLLATAAGALAENAVKHVATRIRKTAVEKTPKPVKQAAKDIAKAAKAPKKTAKKAAKKVVKKASKSKAKKSKAKKSSNKTTGKKAKKSKSRRR